MSHSLESVQIVKGESMDPRTADLIGVYKVEAWIHGPPIWSEFLKGDERIHGPSIWSKFIKGKAWIHGPPI